jgi:hypothetical protein
VPPLALDLDGNEIARMFRVRRAQACGAGQPESARARAVLKAAVMLALVVRASLVEFFTCNISGDDQIVWVEI